MTHRTHAHSHAFMSFNPLAREGLVVASRRNMLKASMTGLAGIKFACLLAQRALATPARDAKAKSVILLWMTGGPSQIDTWDPKPDRPFQNRGPFGVISTKLPACRSANICPNKRQCSTNSPSFAR